MNSNYFVVLFGVGIAVATVRLRYYQIARVLKWLALVLFAYVVAAIDIGPDWRSVLRDAFVPSIPHGREAWGMLVAILGTTISPYLFFWQASQEVEEEKAMGRRMLRSRQRRDAAGDRGPQDRRRSRDVLLQPRDVLHHPDDRADAPPAWRDARSRRRARSPRRCGLWRAGSPNCSTRSA